MQAHPIFPVPTPHRQGRSPIRTRALLRRRVGQGLGSGSIVFAFFAFVLVLLGDRYWLALPAAAAAVALAQLVLYRYNERQVAALLGNATGMCALLMWVIVELVVRRLIGFDFSLINTLRELFAG